MMLRTFCRLLVGLALASFSFGVSAQTLLVGAPRDTALIEPHIAYNFLGLSQLRDAALSCFEVEDAKAEAEAWQDASARAVASLHASGFSSDFVGRVQTTLETRNPIDCSNPIVSNLWASSPMLGPDWQYSVMRLFEGYNIALLDTAPDPARFDAIADAMRAAAEKLSRSIECEIMSRPYEGALGYLLGHWYAALETGKRQLQAQGYPPDWIEATIAIAHVGAFDYHYDLDLRLELDLVCHANRTENHVLRLMTRDDFTAIILAAIQGDT